MSPDGLGYFLERAKTPVAKAGRLPNTETVANLPREERKSAKRIAQHLKEQFERGLDLRRTHSVRWMQVSSILNGIHYFNIDTWGGWTPLRKKEPNQIRAVVPMMDPFYRWEHGRLNANQLGVTTTPTTGRGDDAFYRARLAQDAVNHWIEETDVEAVDDEANQHLLVYGMTALYNEKMPHRNQTFLRPFPGCELFPVPHDARNWEEMDGVMRVVTVSRDWLEMQDELYERRNGRPPTRKMSSLSDTQTADMHARFTGFSAGLQYKSKFDGATCFWVWMKPTELNPYGEHMFMVEDKLFGYVSGLDQQGRKIALVDDELPLRPVYYVKKPNDWWGYGFCEGLVSMQLEANRQMTNLIVSAQRNRGLLAYNSDLINAADVQDSMTGFVPFNSPGPEQRTQPLFHFPPTNVGKDVGAVLTVVHDFAKRAAAYESDILFGQQEGRTEGGPATNLLNANAQAPLQPVLDRKYRALKKIYRAILGDIREVWPDDKRIQALGTEGLATERIIRQNDLPDNHEVQLSPLPLVVNGRTGMVNLLLTLRGMKGDDGKTPLISARELRRSLQMLNMAPPGLVMYNPIEQRIKWRIGQLINDGQRPAIPPATQDPQSFQWMEDHGMMLNMLRNAILDPAFRMYSQPVRQALAMELKFHHERVGNIVRPPDTFDDASDEFEARQMENMMEADEMNPETPAGTYMPGEMAMAT